jgi:hypothetical protein
MSGATTIPIEVLSRALGEAIAGRRVCAAVFTTFTFDPGFFEIHILPVLFEQPFSQVDKVKRIQLEYAMRGLDELAVYYDRGGLAQDAEPAQLDYRRIDVHRSTGVFHPKIVFLLLDELPEELGVDDDEEVGETSQTLLVGIASANLTRSGWWENVECAHFEEINDRYFDDRRCSFRPDLLAVIRNIREAAADGEDHAALDRIHKFVRRKTQKERFQRDRGAGAWRTRIFCGQGRLSLSEFLSSIRIDTEDWNLEILSPYFDEKGAAPLEALIDTLAPRETRVLLPRELDGSAKVTSASYEAVAELAKWSDLPSEITSRGRDDKAERMSPRRVHAKVYRLWQRRGRDILIVGSANLTSAGTSHSAAGNLEACFFVDVTDSGYPRRWWLEPIDHEVTAFVEISTDEGEGLDEAVIHVSFQFDWKERRLAYRIEGKCDAPFDVCEASGQKLFRVDSPSAGSWVDCGDGPSTQIAALLDSTSFLLLRHEKGAWRVLIREENMAYRPSLLLQLSTAEILEYWSLLSSEQRTSFLEVRVGGSLDGLPVREISKLSSRDTLFDRFAGIYHAFGCLGRHVTAALEEGQMAEAEARLLGARYDSLPVLLEKSLEQDDADPVVLYVTFLCARQLRASVDDDYPDFFDKRSGPVDHLDGLLAHMDALREGIDLGDDGEAFFDWYEKAFLDHAAPPEVSS